MWSKSRKLVLWSDVHIMQPYEHVLIVLSLYQLHQINSQTHAHTILNISQCSNVITNYDDDDDDDGCAQKCLFSNRKGSKIIIMQLWPAVVYWLTNWIFVHETTIFGSKWLIWFVYAQCTQGVWCTVLVCTVNGWIAHCMRCAHLFINS